LNGLTIQDLLKERFMCGCGKVHGAEIDHIFIDNDAVLLLPELIHQYGMKKILMVADSNTYKVAGEMIEKVLLKNRFELRKCIFEESHSLVPDEKAVGKLLIEVENDTDLIIAVGSGTFE
jgi:glycerol-1-phosphate dehydrogenase [NAD(P)+]